MNKILVVLGFIAAGSASAQALFNPEKYVETTPGFDVPVTPPEMRPGYGLEGKGLHFAVPAGQPGTDCVINPVSMRYSYVEVETVELVAGQVFSIPVTVLFDFDESDVRPEGLEALADFYTAVVEGGAEELLVTGHTDSKGTYEYNLDLGLRRAASVALVLAELGFEEIEVASAGESQPKVPNELEDGSDDPKGRQTNRRVDIEIVRVKETEVVSSEVVQQDRNPQIFHRLAADNSVACYGTEPNVAIPVGGNTGLTPNGGVVITVPR